MRTVDYVIRVLYMNMAKLIIILIIIVINYIHYITILLFILKKKNILNEKSQTNTHF